VFLGNHETIEKIHRLQYLLTSKNRLIHLSSRYQPSFSVDPPPRRASWQPHNQRRAAPTPPSPVWAIIIFGRAGGSLKSAIYQKDFRSFENFGSLLYIRVGDGGRTQNLPRWGLLLITKDSYNRSLLLGWAMGVEPTAF
jgi:hypothetical protein